MNQYQFNQLICELSYQLQSKKECKVTHRSFIEALSMSAYFQGKDIKLMISNAITELDK